MADEPTIEEEAPLAALVIHGPDEFDARWHVTGDLREIVDLRDESTNYRVARVLRATEGVEIDSEYSCFYAYAETEEAAELVARQAEAHARYLVIELSYAATGEEFDPEHDEAETVDQLIDQRDHWRERALAAEAALKPAGTGNKRRTFTPEEETMVGRALVTARAHATDAERRVIDGILRDGWVDA